MRHIHQGEAVSIVNRVVSSLTGGGRRRTGSPGAGGSPGRSGGGGGIGKIVNRVAGKGRRL